MENLSLMNATTLNTIINLTTSSSTPNHSYSPEICFLLVAMAMGLPGNILVIRTILFRLRRRSITSHLILQLAVADTLVLLTAPLFLCQLFRGGVWEFGTALCKLLHYICGINMYLSILLVTLMSIDRHLGVVQPFLSMRVRTKSRLWPTMVVAWALAVLLPTPLLAYRQVKNGMCRTYYPTIAHKVSHHLMETIVGFLVPFGIMTVCYIRLARVLAPNRARWRHPSYSKTNRLVTLIIATFALIWTPYHMVNLLKVWIVLNRPSTKLDNFCLRASTIVIALVFLSNAVNPLLYTLTGSCSSHSNSASSPGRLKDVDVFLERQASKAGRRTNCDDRENEEKKYGDGREPIGAAEETTTVLVKREEDKQMTTALGKTEGDDEE
ncbi:leukotriene B4 receptor 1 isoform X1 [Esox lucius]|uniref:leukotriene B4 receptor 1 isoform X1 n=2 Tax=Esox lucius TaxID=8010 RepID=UPI0014775792|nr:leukotriene B4 receptor 1 isoform X1 [Esox lucius]